MPGELQLRRGTTLQHSTFTGKIGEVTIDIDKNVVVVHDGATNGGVPLSKESDILRLDTQDKNTINALAPYSGYTQVSKKLDNFVFQTSLSFLNKVADKNRFVKFGDKVVDTYGPELVTNGDFSNGTTGWTAVDSTISISDGALKIYSTATGAGTAYQVVPIVSGKTYRVVVSARGDALGRLRLGSANYYDNVYGQYVGFTGIKEATFTAVGTTLYVALTNGTNGIGQVAYFDNISVREIQTADFTNTVPDVAEILQQTSMTTTVQVSQGDYVLVTRTSSTDHTQTTFRAKQDAPIGTALTNTTYFEDRTSLGVTNQALAYHSYNTLTNAYEGIKTEVLFSDVSKEDLLDNSVWMARNGFSKVSQFLYSKGSYLVLPIGIWQSLNKGAYHPMLNPVGTKALRSTTNSATSTRSWYYDTSLLLGGGVKSVSEAFNYTTETFENTTWEGNGTIISPAYGFANPQGKAYDICYPDQFIDVREYAKILNRDEVNLIIADKEENGVEEVVSFEVVESSIVETLGTSTSQGYVTVGDKAKYSIGDHLMFVTSSGAKRWGIVEGIHPTVKAVGCYKVVYDNVSFYNTSAAGPLAITNGDIYTSIIRFKTKPILSSNTKLSIDLIGNPTNYPQVLKDRLSSGVGVVGINPLLVSDTGASMLPIDTNIFKVKDKAIKWLSSIWNNAGTLESSTKLNDLLTDNNNSGTASTLLDNEYLIINYTSKNLPYIQTTPKQVIDVEPKVIASNSHSIYKGALIGNQVSGKIQVGNGANGFESKVLENVEPIGFTYKRSEYGGFVVNGDIVYFDVINTQTPDSYAIGKYYEYINATSYDIDTIDNINNTAYWKLVATDGITTPVHGAIALDNANSSASKWFKAISQGTNGVVGSVYGKEMVWDFTKDSAGEVTSQSETATSWVANTTYLVTGTGGLAGKYITCIQNYAFSVALFVLINNKVYAPDGTDRSGYFITWDGNGFGDNNNFDQLTNGTKTDLNGRTIRTFVGHLPINGEVK